MTRNIIAALMLIFSTSTALFAQNRQGASTLRQGAEAGDPTAQYRLGLAYRDGDGVEQDSARAYLWLSLAAAFGDSDVQPLSRLALVSATTTMSADAVKEAERRGLTEIRRLAEAGQAWAQAFIGIAHLAGTSDLTPKDAVLAVQWLHKAAAQNDARAQFILGGVYQRGEGVPADAAKALEWFHSAARLGNAAAQLSLGNAYHDGAGVAKDYAQAIVWWRRAADQGLVEAQANMGDVYRVGDRGADQDFVEAARWYRKAADQGHAVAQSNLGALYELGLGVLQDGAEAAKWYARSAEQGYAIGQFNLGLLLSSGKGVAADPIEAHKWVNLAASRADSANRKSFADARDRIAQSLTPAQLTEAQQRARAWLDGAARR